jgi:hypothetical protein
LAGLPTLAMLDIELPMLCAGGKPTPNSIDAIVLAVVGWDWAPL